MKETIVILVLTCLSIGCFAQKDNTEEKITDIFGGVLDKAPDEKPQDTQCECVPYYLCRANNTINENGEGIIDIRENGDCESYLEVCCNPANKTDTKIEPDPPKVQKGCGARNPAGYGFRITGDKDNEAQFGEFPWMTAILAEEFNAGTDSVLNVYKCGGSLIHPQAVVTAAHCVASRDKKYKIRAGEWDTQTTKELYPHQDRYVKSIVMHKDYYGGALHNDIAILFLDSPLNISGHINTLCLPQQDEKIPTGTRCFATGWGKDVFGKEGKYQVILKKIELPMVDFNTCQDQLRTTRLGTHFNLDKSFVCAGGEPGKDTCKGDGGSPLACPVPGHPDLYHHVGMVAWGIGCGEKGIPGVYVNVAMFRNWIDDHMKQHHLETSHYQY